MSAAGDVPPFDLTPDSLEVEFLVGRFVIEALVALAGREVPDELLAQWAHAETWTRSLAIAAASAVGTGSAVVAEELVIQLARMARRAGRLAQLLGFGEDQVRGFVSELRS